MPLISRGWPKWRNACSGVSVQKVNMGRTDITDDTNAQAPRKKMGEAIR
jgi:hypothetical protein